MKQPIADLYSDYLLASFGATTATGLSQLLEGEISHDQVTRYLSGPKQTAADLWRTVKSFVREMQSEAGVLIIDDSIEEKPYTDENDLVCWHYDHSKDRLIKGINFLTALYSSQGVSLPVGFHLIAKTEQHLDPKTQKAKRRSPVSKNEACRDLIKQAVAGAYQISGNAGARPFSCFDRLSTNGQSSAISTPAPFALSLSKGEQQICGVLSIGLPGI